MASTRQHQEAHGIGQIEEQLHQQTETAVNLQGESELDREVEAASKQRRSELDEIVES